MPNFARNMGERKSPTAENYLNIFSRTLCTLLSDVNHFYLRGGQIVNKKWQRKEGVNGCECPSQKHHCFTCSL